jgi:lipopolysaccharide export system permease protein
MRLLDRYLLRELLIPLGFCLCGFLIFWIAFDLFSELGKYQENNLQFLDVAEYYLVKVPEFLVTVVPVALLLALLYTLTNHARYHELTAMRAAGVSLGRICLPYLTIGLLLSLGLFALNELWVPNSSDKAELIMKRRAVKKAGAPDKDVQQNLGFQNARDGRFWVIESYNVKTHVMLGPSVNWNLPDGSGRWLVAKRGEYTNDVWTFFDNVQEYTNAPGVSSYTLVMQTNVMAMPEFSETPAQIKREIKIANRLSVRAAHSAEIPVLEILDYLDLHRNLSPRNNWWLFTQLHGRLALPWTCLVVVLVAIPFGAASGRRNVFVGVASSIFICFAYFILMRLGLALGTGGYVPAWIAAWLPNLSFGIAAAWMISRVR